MTKLISDHRKLSIWKLIFLKSKVKGDFYRIGNFLLASPCLAKQRPKKAKFLTEIKEEYLILLEGRQGLAAQELENEKLQKKPRRNDYGITCCPSHLGIAHCIVHGLDFFYCLTSAIEIVWEGSAFTNK
ncbi:MAG: hypothetical protein V3T60_11375 [Candidatus Binatia bacterium]